MEIKQEPVYKYGLIGKDIGYSFSRSFFKAKFKDEGIKATYHNLDCADINQIKNVLDDTDIKGYNVTIPYKEVVIDLIDELDEDARAIGAVNTIKRMADGRLKGYNTDHIGFRESLLQSEEGYIFETALREKKTNLKALILGTGGASKAIVYALSKMGVSCQYVSRKRTKTAITYDDLDEQLLLDHSILINCTPLGTFPDVDQCPDIPFDFITLSHIVYDVIYNPSETVFLKKAKEKGASIQNGLPMLEGQALASWEIWQS